MSHQQSKKSSETSTALSYSVNWTINQGYNQQELAPESRYITTFSTHMGLMRYTRLNFGISSAAEIFQNVIREALEGISGAINIFDDILVLG